MGWHKLQGLVPVVTLGFVLITMPASMPAWAEGHKLLETCHRGKLEVCHEMLARPRLAAGTRAAIELFLDEIETKQQACASGDAVACEAIAREHPDLPQR